MSVIGRLRLSSERFALIFTQPFGGARRRVQNWIATRTPRVIGPWVVNRRRVYILPTRYGYGYALLLLVMLAGAMNYSNSMAFALTFLLAALGLIGMHLTHGNLVNVQVRQMRAPPVFAGEAAAFSLAIENPTPALRYALGAAWQDQSPARHVDVPVSSNAELHLQIPAARRGWMRAPRFSVSTEFPLGLFHAWTWVELDMNCLIYPQPAARSSAAPASSGGRGARTGVQIGQEEFAGLRSYQRGDSPRSIHWKSFPKHRVPMVKQFADTLENELWLDWSTLPPAWDTERRLSQLARWVLDAEAGGRAAYGLRLPGVTRAPGRGEIQRHECLKILALFGGGA